MKDLDKAFLGHPKPIFSLSMTELWERFSFYGIRPLLLLFMAAAIFEGGLGMDKAQASAIVGIFGSCLYLAALPGGWIADNILGLKLSVFLGCVIIALGHLSIGLSYFQTEFFFLGLALIVIGTGLFKTCSSVMISLLYKKDDPRVDSGFTIFYMGINLGAFVAPIVCGFLQKEYGWHLGFGAGGIGMLIALIIFYFVVIPNFKEFDEKIGLSSKWDAVKEISYTTKWILALCLLLIFGFLFLSLTGLIKLDPISISEKMIFLIVALTTIYFIYLFFFSSLNLAEKKNLIIFVVLLLAASIFWSVFEQKPTSFNLFAQSYTQRVIFGFEIPTPWFQSFNPLFIITFAPIIAFIWVFLARKGLELSSLTKFSFGLLGGAICFFIMYLASLAVLEGGGARVSMLYIILAIFFLTLGEICLSPVGLSIMTKIAPNLIKNQVMGLWFVSSALGNVIAGLIGGNVSNDKIQNLPDIFSFLALMLFVSFLLLFLCRNLIIKISKAK